MHGLPQENGRVEPRETSNPRPLSCDFTESANFTERGGGELFVSKFSPARNDDFRGSSIDNTSQNELQAQHHCISSQATMLAPA